jgi:hypothetical protein
MNLVVGTGPVLPTDDMTIPEKAKWPRTFLLSEAFLVRLAAFGCLVLAQLFRQQHPPGTELIGG